MNGCSPQTVTPRGKSIYTFLTISALVLLSSLLFHTQPLTAQSGPDAAITLTEFGGGVLIEWGLPDELSAQATAATSAEDGALTLFADAGWDIDLLDNIELPASTISVWEAPLGEGETAILPDEVVALVDVFESTPWPFPIAPKEMPALADQDGDRLPFVSPLDPPEALAPAEPVFVLRAGMQRGEQRFVIAVSPIYADGETLRLATKGSATLIGVTLGPSQADPEPAPSDAAALPTSDAEGTPADLPSEAGTTTLPLTSPLDTPQDPRVESLLTAPLTSPLDEPTVAPTVAPEPTGTVVPENRSDTVDSTTSQVTTEAAPPPEPQEEPPLASTRPNRSPVTPWMGLLTFAFFGLALVFILFSGRE